MRIISWAIVLLHLVIAYGIAVQEHNRMKRAYWTHMQIVVQRAETIGRSCTHVVYDDHMYVVKDADLYARLRVGHQYRCLVHVIEDGTVRRKLHYTIEDANEVPLVDQQQKPKPKIKRHGHDI